LSAEGDVSNVDPLLGSLANNGGGIETEALLVGSPAIDAGSSMSYLPTDERGILRPQDGDGDGTAISDIGAYELEAAGNLNYGLRAYYPFNGNANDETGHGYDGTVIGATLTADRFGNPMSAYSFDGIDDEIVIGPEPNFPAWDTYSVSLWFLNDGGGDQGPGYGQKILSKAEFFSDFHLAVGWQRSDAVPGNLSWWSSQGGFDSVVDPYTDYRDSKWHYAVFNKNTPTDGDLWVDGTLRASSTTLQAVENHQDLVIGYTTHTDPFQQKHWSGSIDDIRIYNRALSPSEIQELFREGGFANPKP
jgi:hypothetical protein